MKSITSPQAMVDLRAQIEECNPGFCKVLGAFNLKGWKNGKRKLNNREISAYSGLTVDRVKDLTKEMVERGWLARSRKAGGEYVYEKTIEEMTWDEAHEIGRLRLSGVAQQTSLSLDVPRGTSRGGGGNFPPGSGEFPLRVGGISPSPNINKDLLKDSLKESPAPEGPGWTHQDLVNDYFEAWKALQAEMTPARSLDLQAHIKRGVKALGALSKAPGFDRGEYLRRLANMGKHKFHAKKDHALNYFCSTYSEFADGQRSLEEAPGRRYHASGTDDFA